VNPEDMPEQLVRQIETANRLMKELQGDDPLEAIAQEEEKEDSLQQETEEENLESLFIETDSTHHAPEEKESSPAPFEQQFRTLQGKYTAEVPVLHQKLREQQQYIDQLQEQLNTSVLSKTPVDVGSLRDVIGEDDFNLLDDDVKRVIYKIANAVSENAVKKVVVPKINEIKDRVHITETEQFYKGLSEKAPEWERSNTDPKFLSWLDEKDPFTGVKRLDILKNAYNNLDIERVSSFFNHFKTGKPKAETKPNVVLPAKSRTVAVQTKEVARPTITRAQIQRFYADAALGKFEGKEERKSRIQKEIFDAQREGRVRP
jgi:hypothetical protein